MVYWRCVRSRQPAIDRATTPTGPYLLAPFSATEIGIEYTGQTHFRRKMLHAETRMWRAVNEQNNGVGFLAPTTAKRRR